MHLSLRLERVILHAQVGRVTVCKTSFSMASTLLHLALSQTQHQMHHTSAYLTSRRQLCDQSRVLRNQSGIIGTHLDLLLGEARHFFMSSLPSSSQQYRKARRRAEIGAPWSCLSNLRANFLSHRART